MKSLILFSLIFLTGCTAGEFMFGAENAETTETSIGILSTILGAVGGPMGVAAGSLLTTAAAVGKNVYQNKKNKSKIALAEEAFIDVVDGVEKAKSKLPPKELEKLHAKLDEALPDAVKDLIRAAKEVRK